MRDMDTTDLLVGGAVAETCRPCFEAIGCDPGLALLLAVAIGVALQLSRVVVPTLWRRMIRRTEKELPHDDASE